MAQDSLRNIVLGSVVAMLFVFSVFSFYISIGAEYDKDTSDLTNNYYDFSEINESLSNTQEEAERLREIASEGSDSGGLLSFVSGFFDGVGAFFGVAFSMFVFIIDLFDLILVGTMSIIFANPIITGTAIAIVILLVLFAIFRFLKQGD
jgi:hypothetical protein